MLPQTSLVLTNSPALHKPLMLFRPESASSTSDLPYSLPCFEHVTTKSVFVKRGSLMAQLIQLRSDLYRSEQDNDLQHAFAIAQIERVLLDVRAQRVSELHFSGLNDICLYVLHD